MENISLQEDTLVRELETLVENIQDKKTRSDIQYVFDSLWSLVVLRCRDFNTAAALNSLTELQNAVRHKHSDWFRKFQPEALRTVLESGAIKILKDKDTQGNCVLLIRISEWNVKLFSFEDLVAAAVMAGIELIQVDPDMQINGGVIIIDVKGMSFAQARQVTPHALKKLIDIIFFATPLKVHGIHVVNLNFVVNALVKLAKSLLPSKFASLLITHNNPHSLHPYIPQKSLPSWLGGVRSEDDEDVFNEPIKQACFHPEKLKWYEKIVEIANDENSKSIMNKY